VDLKEFDRLALEATVGLVRLLILSALEMEALLGDLRLVGEGEDLLTTEGEGIHGLGVGMGEEELFLETLEVEECDEEAGE